MSRLLEILPESHRVNIQHPSLIKRTIQRPSPESVAANDPSEAVRSAEILRELTRSFEVIYRANFGGTLLQFLLADIVGHFSVDDPKDRALLELLVLFEETLVVDGIIPSDFVMVVARPHGNE